MEKSSLYLGALIVFTAIIYFFGVWPIIRRLVRANQRDRYVNYCVSQALGREVRVRLSAPSLLRNLDQRPRGNSKNLVGTWVSPQFARRNNESQEITAVATRIPTSAHWNETHRLLVVYNPSNSEWLAALFGGGEIRVKAIMAVHEQYITQFLGHFPADFSGK